MGLMRLIAVLAAAGTALTNSTAETVLASHVFPANFFSAGKVIKVRGSVRSTATNATDTLTVRVRIGATTLTGTAVFTSAAVDQVNDDTCVFDLELVVRDADSSGTLVVGGFASPPDATATAVVSIAPAPLTGLDFTGAIRLEVTGQWSVQNAGNSCQAEMLNVWEAA
jgi:hypothetical protein